VDEGLFPAEGTDLVFSDPTTISWSADPAALSYSLYRGTIVDGVPWAYDHTCFASGLGSPASGDPSDPPDGTAYYYLAAGHNACGEGPLGNASDGTPRPNPASCP
jgi:hypothetical protein